MSARLVARGYEEEIGAGLHLVGARLLERRAIANPVVGGLGGQAEELLVAGLAFAEEDELEAVVMQEVGQHLDG